jgi:DNA-damage-inducible protein D
MASDDNQGSALLPFEGNAGDGRLLRRQWHDDRWFFSVVDVVGVLTDAPIPRNYWSDLKRRLAHDEGFSELHAKIVQLKMRSLDGKLRETDAADTETMLRIVQSIPSPKAEPVKQWLAREGARRLEEVAATLDEAPRRLLLRREVAQKNVSLNSAASERAGVLTRRDFAVFHDAGYRGMYNGERENDIHARKGLAKGEKILDWMGSEELAANLFRITQTEAKLRRGEASTREEANQTHYAMGKAVRQFIADQGGTMPEDLPTPAQSIRQIERAEAKRLEAQRQSSLFPPDAGNRGGAPD